MPQTAYWLIKSEPSVYAWSKLVADGQTAWEGVRNYQARNHLRAMAVGDLCFYYHSNEGKEIVGIAKVVKTFYPDPTQEAGEDWSVVDVSPVEALPKPVTLATLKATPSLAKMQILTHIRLSVVPVLADEWQQVRKLGGLDA